MNQPTRQPPEPDLPQAGPIPPEPLLASTGADRPLAAFRQPMLTLLAVLLSIYTLVAINLPLLPTQAQRVIFVAIGTVFALMAFPTFSRLRRNRALAYADLALALIAGVSLAYIAANDHLIPLNAGRQPTYILAFAALAVIVTLDATRRCIGLTLPILALLAIAYAMLGPSLPHGLLPHRGMNLPAVVESSALKAEGLFGDTANAMFRYVFPFFVFGAFLEATGATAFVLWLSRKLVGGGSAAPAKVSILASGLTGSVSGSAVANAVTTGTFTIPLMKQIGFSPARSAGIEAAASAGGALVPPVMGAGAYIMLEFLGEHVSLLQILQAAIIPATLYYFALFLLVHLDSRRLAAIGSHRPTSPLAPPPNLPTPNSPPSGPPSIDLAPHPVSALCFVGSLGLLIGLLLSGFSPFRAATYAIGLLLLLLNVHPRVPLPRSARLAMPLTAIAMFALAQPILRHLGQTDNLPNTIVAAIALSLTALLALPAWSSLLRRILASAAISAIPLIAAAGCVGIIIALTYDTGLGTSLPLRLLPHVQDNLPLALLALMVCSIVLGMGLPSAVCYALLAAIAGSTIAQLPIPLLAGHFFIFYFGLMSMVTPPVALAAYATAQIAGATPQRASLYAFRYALAGFTLPYMFVYRPELLLIPQPGQTWAAVVYATFIAVAGIVGLAAALAGHLRGTLRPAGRCVAALAGTLALFPDPGLWQPLEPSAARACLGFSPSPIDLLGIALLVPLFFKPARAYRASDRTSRA